MIKVDHNIVDIFTEHVDGKLYLVFQSGNHICGRIAVANSTAYNQSKLRHKLPEEILEYFLEHGYEWA